MLVSRIKSGLILVKPGVGYVTGPTPRVAVKRAIDVVLSGLALLVLAPLFLILIRLVRRDGGAAFYAQRRVGHAGMEFRCFKFRTMVPNAEQHLQAILANDPALRAEYERFWKLKNDPRVTSIGSFLRRSSIDELPQLINVFVGEMSLVGPRPRSVAEVEFMNAKFHHAATYTEVKPGLTGPWQVSGRNHLSLEEKAQMDASYARGWSIVGDFKLMLLTVGTVVTGHGAA